MGPAAEGLARQDRARAVSGKGPVGTAACGVAGAADLGVPEQARQGSDRHRPPSHRHAQCPMGGTWT